jgi:DNA (cytosine-5)-methyltransferase 1
LDGLAFPAAGCDQACAAGRSLSGISLCAGAGGLDLGLHIAIPEYRTVAYVEREAYAAATLVARMEDAALDRAPVWDDVGTFDGRPWRGLVDIVHGGYPCQPFSVAGRKLGDKDPRHLWPHIARIVSEIEPPLCFFENVSGHLRLGFEQVHDDLRQMGYRIKAGLFTAEEVGAPHRRERLFILAHRESDGWRQRESEQLSPQRQSASASSGSAAPMVHAECTQRRQDQSAGYVTDRGIAERQEASGRAGEPGAAIMADPARVFRKTLQRSEPDGAGSFVGNTHGARLERRDYDEQSGGNTQQPFPPGPADKRGWEEFLRARPDLEPAVRGGTDGLAHRVDRLRLCGNGVVPLAAAYAFRTLAAAANINIYGT